MSARVLLVNPNQVKPAVAPLALEYLAEALAERGMDARLCDLCFEPDPRAALGAALQDDFDLVGVTVRQTDDCYMASGESFIPWMRQIVEWIRSATAAPVVLGGAGFSVAPTGILRRTGADYGIIGDGEHVLTRLAASLARGPISAEECLRIPGLASHSMGSVTLNPTSWPPLSTRALPRRWLDNTRYFAEGGQAGIETRRGCPHKCIYCVDWKSKGRQVRLRHVDVVADEIESLLAQGVDVLHTCDSEFNVPGYHAEAVCRELIRRGLHDMVRWYAYCAPRPFTCETAAAMADAGCAGIDFGADSGDPLMLQRLRRTHAPDDIRNCAALCRAHGITAMFDLLLGGPGESVESIERTIGLMQEIDADCVGISVGVRIYPGTEVERLVRRQGFDASNPNLRGCVEGNEDMVLPAYYLDSEIGDDIFGLLEHLIGDDSRFFLGGPVADQADYNYSDNQVLVDAIRGGARGAYWDILRKLRSGADPCSMAWTDHDGPGSHGSA